MRAITVKGPVGVSACSENDTWDMDQGGVL